MKHMPLVLPVIFLKDNSHHVPPLQELVLIIRLGMNESLLCKVVEINIGEMVGQETEFSNVCQIYKLSLLKVLRDLLNNPPHLTDDETESQKGKGSCPKLNSCLLAAPGLELTPLANQASTSIRHQSNTPFKTVLPKGGGWAALFSNR